jgi:putative sterol carrier protein
VPCRDHQRPGGSEPWTQRQRSSTGYRAASTRKIAGIEHSYLFDVSGEGRWLVDVRDGGVTVTEGWDGPPDAICELTPNGGISIVAGTQSPTMAYMTGKIKVDGDIGAALKLQKLF